MPNDYVVCFFAKKAICMGRKGQEGRKGQVGLFLCHEGGLLFHKKHIGKISRGSCISWKRGHSIGEI